jgi:hypothetical protein
MVRRARLDKEAAERHRECQSETVSLSVVALGLRRNGKVRSRVGRRRNGRPEDASFTFDNDKETGGDARFTLAGVPGRGYPDPILRSRNLS